MQEVLLSSLLAIAASILLVNLINFELANDFKNIIAIPLSWSVMILSVILVSKYGLTGNHGKAWMLFSLFATYWFLAESFGFFYDLVFEEPLWEYANEFFHISGYPLFFGFLYYYLKPLQKAIPRKLVLTSIMVSIAMMIPVGYMVIESNDMILNENHFFHAVYPLLDSVIFVPALIGVIMFFRGKVNFMLTMLCLGIVSLIIGDSARLFVDIHESYHVGHPIDIMILWAYALFGYGLFNQIRYLNEKPEKKSNNSQNSKINLE